MAFVSEARRIDRNTANSEISRYNELARPSKALISGIMDLTTKKPDFEQFHLSSFNAFVFSRDEVLRFFFGDAIPPSPEGQAKHLMVILGAQHEQINGFQIGQPTVIISGVNEMTDNTEGPSFKFRSLNITDPATEYPPRSVIAELPGAGDGDTIFFTIK